MNLPVGHPGRVGERAGVARARTGRPSSCRCPRRTPRRRRGRRGAVFETVTTTLGATSSCCRRRRVRPRDSVCGAVALPRTCPRRSSTARVVSSAPRLAPSSLNCTPATVPLSDAVAVTEHGAGDRGARRRRRDRDGRRRRVGGGGGARLVPGRADVAGDVLGGDLVVVGAGGEAGVGVARAGRLRDPVAGGGREAGARAAVDVVAGDARRCRSPRPRPSAIWPRPPVAVSVPGRARRRRVRRADRRVHVGLDLGGGAGRGCRCGPRRSSPWNHSPQIALPPIFSAPVEVVIAPLMRELAGLRRR